MANSGKIGSAIIRVLTRPVAILPLSFHRSCGRFIGKVIRNVAHYRTDVVMTNLARCFPEKKYDELREISRKFYAHLGTLFCESLWIGGHDAAAIRRSHIAEMSNPELLNDLYDKGKSVFVMSSHNGNWELSGGYVSYAYKEPLKCPENDVVVVYRKLHNAAWDRFMGWNRKSPVVDQENYDGMVETFDVMRFAIRNRHVRKIYNFIMDQYPYSDSSKVDVRFMGQDTVSMNGAPALAHRLRMAVVYMSMKLKEDGNYTMTYDLIAEDASTMSVESILEQYYSRLEADLREQPWNYLWTHKRWK